MSATTSLETDFGRVASGIFGFQKLSAEQEVIIRASIADVDVLGILPTAGGKSACFQIPGIVKRIRTLVISPLIALQEDQVQALRARNVKAFAYHSGMSDARKAAAEFYFKKSPRDEPSFLYISPEVLMSETFFQKFGGAGFSSLAVDEAHCVSTWGESFRPDYQRIAIGSRRMGISHCAAFTATVDPKVEADIKSRLPLSRTAIKVAASPLRSNLTLQLSHIKLADDEHRVGPKARLARFLQLLSSEHAGTTIAYLNSRTGAGRLHETMHRMKAFCRKFRYTPALFHADIPFEEKQRTLDVFKKEERPLIIATSAFGMGIDRADVRQVIHYHMPHTLIDYAQQFGRAGRDGKPSLCTTLLSPLDFARREDMRISYETPSVYHVERVLGILNRVLKKLEPAERKHYRLPRFLKWMEVMADRNEAIKHPASYMSRARGAVSILVSCGLITEDARGLQTAELLPGSATHMHILERTQMHERMLKREIRRIELFFQAEHPTQEYLWEILSQE